jgi:hypothetical protein
VLPHEEALNDAEWNNRVSDEPAVCDGLTHNFSVVRRLIRIIAKAKHFLGPWTRSPPKFVRLKDYVLGGPHANMRLILSNAIVMDIGPTLY